MHETTKLWASPFLAESVTQVIRTNQQEKFDLSATHRITLCAPHSQSLKQPTYIHFVVFHQVFFSTHAYDIAEKGELLMDYETTTFT